MSSNRIKIKLLRVPSLDDPKVALVEKGETFVIEDSGVLCYKHHTTGEIFNPFTSSAAVYVHPTGDGNLHVPATGTTNNNKVLKAGTDAGTLNWAFVDWNEVTNKPTSFAPPVASATTLGGVKLPADGAFGVDAQGNLVLTAKGAPGGVAELDAQGRIPTSQLPSFVDSVQEVASYAALPAAGSAGKMYVTLDTNKVYRWSGSTYIEISSGGTADAAVKLAAARTISLSGDAAGSVSFDGSANADITVALLDVDGGSY